MHTVTNNILKYVDVQNRKEHVIEFSKRDLNYFFVDRSFESKLNIVFDMDESIYIEPQHFDVLCQELIGG